MLDLVYYTLTLYKKIEMFKKLTISIFIFNL